MNDSVADVSRGSHWEILRDTTKSDKSECCSSLYPKLFQQANGLIIWECNEESSKFPRILSAVLLSLILQNSQQCMAKYEIRDSKVRFHSWTRFLVWRRWYLISFCFDHQLRSLTHFEFNTYALGMPFNSAKSCGLDAHFVLLLLFDLTQHESNQCTKKCKRESFVGLMDSSQTEVFLGQRSLVDD
jgi:hypothetical protein